MLHVSVITGGKSLDLHDHVLNLPQRRRLPRHSFCASQLSLCPQISLRPNAKLSFPPFARFESLSFAQRDQCVFRLDVGLVHFFLACHGAGLQTRIQGGDQGVGIRLNWEKWQKDCDVSTP